MKRLEANMHSSSPKDGERRVRYNILDGFEIWQIGRFVYSETQNNKKASHDPRADVIPADVE